MKVDYEINMGQCEPQCLLTAFRSDVCHNLEKEIVYNPMLTFWVYLVIRVFLSIIGKESTYFPQYQPPCYDKARRQ